MRLFTKRVIRNFQGQPYLIRYTLISTRFFRCFIHKILRSDDDRDLHDHPWNFATLLLWGRYREQVPYDSPPMFLPDGKMIVKSKIVGPGTLVCHKAADCHRLDLQQTFKFPTERGDLGPVETQFIPVWTLFMAGPRKRDWGFHTSKGWIQWEEYIEDRKLPADMED